MRKVVRIRNKLLRMRTSVHICKTWQRKVNIQIYIDIYVRASLGGPNLETFNTMCVCICHTYEYVTNVLHMRTVVHIRNKLYVTNM